MSFLSRLKNNQWMYDLSPVEQIGHILSLRPTAAVLPPILLWELEGFFSASPNYIHSPRKPPLQYLCLMALS